MHYRDDKNDFKDIGNDFVPSDKPGYAWSNGANQFNAEFKALLGKDFLRLDVGGDAFSATLEGSLPVPAVALGVEITYAGAVPHVDLAYHALPDEVREYLTLLDPLAQSTFRFILSPPDGAKVLPEQRKDGSWAFHVAPEAAPAFVLEAPRATDSSGKSEDNPDGENPDGKPHATMTVTQVKEGFAVDLAIDETWLKDPQRVFPVTLDPTIGLQPPVEDASFATSCPTCTPTTADHLYIGTTSTTVWRGALQFDLPAIPAGAVVSSASLKLYFDKRCLSTSGSLCGGVAHQINAHRMTAAWSTSSTSSQLAFDPAVIDSFTLPANPGLQWMSWTITGTLQNWLAGTQPNYGLLLKRNTEPLNVNGPTPVAKRYAGEPALRPVLEVTYTANAVYLYPPEILRSNGAALRWSPYYSPGGPQFTSYEVHRSATPGFTPSDSTLLATITDVAVTSFTDTAARPSVGFTYKIKTGTAVSNERTVTLPSDGTATMTLQPVAARGVASSLHYYSGYTNCDNAGAEPRIQAGTTATDIYRPVEFFDLRDIPAGAAVSSATLKVWNDTPPSWTPTVEVHRVTRDWEEGTGVGAAACTANGATWWDTKAGTGWSTLGGDFDSTVEASKVKTAGGDPVWDSFTVTSLVQKWVNTDAPNFGVLLKVSNETLTAGHTFSYASDDYSEAVALRPQLTVSWADGSHAVAPTVSVSGPAPGTQVSGTGVTVSAAASDDRRVESVAFLLDDGSIGSDSTPPFSITWNSTTATNGAHTLKARATDDAGNVTTSAGSAITVSNYAAPTTGITLPTNGSTVRGTTTVTATASAAAGLTVSRVEFYVDGVQFAEKTSSPYSVQWNTLDPAVPSYDNDPATPHVLTTVVVDSSGQDVTSADVTVNVDNRQSSLYKATLATDADAFPPTVVYDPAGSLQLTYPIDVTITNNSSVTWSATDISLRYRWYNPQAPALASGTDPNVTDGPQNALGQSLAPGGSMTKTLNVSPPTLPDGVSRSTYRLQIDLFQISTSSWFAAKGNQPKENPVIINKKLMADALGLERYYQYVGADLGAGMQQLTNVANGNSVIRWTPFTSKGRGLSTVVNLTYNSLEDHSRSPAGNNVSLSISSVIPFGS